MTRQQWKKIWDKYNKWDFNKWHPSWDDVIKKIEELVEEELRRKK